MGCAKCCCVCAPGDWPCSPDRVHLTVFTWPCSPDRVHLTVFTWPCWRDRVDVTVCVVPQTLGRMHFGSQFQVPVRRVRRIAVVHHRTAHRAPPAPPPSPPPPPAPLSPLPPTLSAHRPLTLLTSVGRTRLLVCASLRGFSQLLCI